MKRLASHLLFSYEQGIKIQVFEFFKVLLDNDQSEKKVEFNDLFYKEILISFLNFINTVENLPDRQSAEPMEGAEESKQDPNYSYYANQYNKSLEYSRSLVV
jgi:hypothetical protein